MRIKKINALMVIVVMLISILGNKNNIMLKAANEEKGNYIIIAKTSNDANKIKTQYGVTQTVCVNGGEELEENNIVSTRITATEAVRLQETKGVKSVEKDAVVSACSIKKQIHPKKIKLYKKNYKDAEWNLQMIRATHPHNKTRHKIKVAVLDSGVDCENDIDLSYSVSLVPGEENVNPLFMDGSGHGNSVAGLIAAQNNKEGITGVNPNVQICSIRILDDNNQAPISRVVEGIYTAINQKVDIINMSFGINQYSKAMHQAVKDANDAGILLVAAAGNTGKLGVQYPAAFKEVMAVGAVNKDGDVSKFSARGGKVEIVAPGELVRTTGEFGSELVTSGTSLAAPQVAGVASLLMESNPRKTADEIRNILDISANCYADEREMGSGLLDYENALKSMLSKSTMQDEYVGKNKDIVVYEDTGCVEGSWKKNDHEALVTANYSNVKKGARYPDLENQLMEEGKEINGKKLYIFAGMCHNPWWHGYYQRAHVQNKSGAYQGDYYNNYVACYIYLTRLANEFVRGSIVGVPGGISTTVKNEIKRDLGKIDWVREFGYVPTSGTKRAFVWGMALHSLGDAYAHSTWTKKNGVISHSEGADNNNFISQRWKHAKQAVNAAITKYKLGANASGTYNEFASAKNATDYKMVNLYKYITEVAGQKTAKQYSGGSHDVKLS